MGPKLQVFDTPGLVLKEDKGNNNAFLSELDNNKIDGIYHIVRAFRDTHVNHQLCEVDPVRDMKIVVDLLIAKDLQTIKK